MTLAEMQFVPPVLRLASAEIFILFMACLILIVDLFVKDKKPSKRSLSFALTQVTLLGAVAIVFAMSSGQVEYTFSNMYVSDLLGDLLKVLICITVVVVLFYSRSYILSRPSMAKVELYTLSLFATLGMMVMVSANHFLPIYIGIELLSLSLYAMIALNRDSAV
ncbi:MAG: NADH:ubiquinone oxidoreductase subunit N, partial [Propionivibrio sp.]